MGLTERMTLSLTFASRGTRPSSSRGSSTSSVYSRAWTGAPH